ncbi:MAG: ABC transporter substrate-binding protein [Clostridia bacterium]|nr:ABC transporter substrate-binding protein [Clostridia bacterium]
MKKLVSLILAAALLAVMLLCLASCGGSGKPTVGIIQFGSHASLNNCYDGIMAKFTELYGEELPFEVEHVISNFDGTVSAAQAQMMVNKKVDVIVAIATPSAVAAATSADGEVPVVFCAVTDASTMENYENVTGSSDIPNFDKQLGLVTSMLGKESGIKIGVLYSTEESSSPIQVASLKAAAAKYENIEICDSIVADITTIDAKVNELIARDVDCFINLLDNTIIGKLETNILPITNEAGVPVFGSEVEQVRAGCAGSASIEYTTVGATAAEAVYKILNGTDADSIEVAVIQDPALYFNSDVCAKFGLVTPAGGTATDVAE